MYFSCLAKWQIWLLKSLFVQVEKVTFEIDIFTCKENTGIKNGCILFYFFYFKQAKVNSMTSPLCSFVYALVLCL